MKILVGGLSQENNSFSACLSDETCFRILRGEELKTRGPVQGFCAAAREADADAEFVFSVQYQTLASGGPVKQSVVDAFLQEFLEVYRTNTPFDAIFMDLHGATEIEGGFDGCGYILENVRREAGNDIVIAFSSDMHGNITEKMFHLSDAIAGWQTYPHKDFFETGYRAASLALRKMTGKPMEQAYVRIPMIVPAEGYSSNEGPFAEMMNKYHRLVEEGTILDFTVYQMQPWLNVPEAGSVVLVAAEDQDTAAHYAKKLAHNLFDLRKEMEIELYPIDDVIDAAIGNKTEMPVVLVDSADSPNAGSSADSSFVLARLLERGETLKACLTVADPAAAAHAFEVGVGNEGDFSLGGQYEPRFQKPIQVHAYVKQLHDGNYPTYTSSRKTVSAGKTAVLQIGNIHIVVFTKMGASSDPQCYRAFGIEPARYELVMVKSANQYKEPYSEFSTLFYPTDTPGSSTANLRSLPFDKLPRPFYPLDEIENFDDTVIFRR